MKILKKELITLSKILGESKLSLSDARIRDTFLKPVIENVVTFEKDRAKIINEYCEKDEKGEPVNNNGTYSFKENLVEFQKEFNLLLEEEIDIECKNINKIKEFIENTDYKPEVGETEIIDNILKKLC